ncbi:MAG: CaiB/BaiF CoA-transferase family protein [Xanthobacteraceae bacterium]|jgi:crotonobetainyl-CoA:carnitine CoA-transferase CaiB-like acyl-CoA transferase
MAGCLSHVRVLDLSRVFAGPFAGQMLADFGADVIKIEHPVHGDDVRRMGIAHKDRQGRDTDQTAPYLAANRGKRSIGIDISKAAGQTLVKKLAGSCDVLIENYKTGNLARYGLDYPALRTINPRLVYCSITGFGQSGPYSELPGYDPIFQAMSGVMSVTGVPEGQPGAGASLVGYSVSDMTAGCYAAIAILAALNHRDRVSGRGQHIDLALLDSQVHAASHIAMNYLVSGRMPVRAGTSSQTICPWQAFDCADMPLMLAVGTDQQFARLCETMGLPGLATDPRFLTNRKRMENKPALIPVLAERFKTRTARQWMDAFAAVGVASGPINDFGQVFADPQVKHREMLREIPHPLSGTLRIIANPVRFSDTPVEYGRWPPLLGEHTTEVLREMLTMGEEEIEALRRDKVIS